MEGSVEKKRAKVILRELKKLYPQPKCALEFKNPYQALVVILLSAQTTDKKVNEISPAFFSRFPDFESLLSVPLSKIEKALNPINYYKTKALRLKQIAKIINEKYQGRIPDNIEELVRLPGIGRKTANAFLWEAYRKTEGIVVDTHVKRLARVYGLTLQTNPEKIEQELMQIIPKGEWGNFSLRMIAYGRKYCPARKHDHQRCPLYLALKKHDLL